MKARLLSNSMRSGHVARDFIALAHVNPNSSTPDIRPKTPAAHYVLDSFEDRNRPFPDEPGPIKRLVRVLTGGLQGIPNLLAGDNGKTNGARLFKGCPVRLRVAWTTDYCSVYFCQYKFFRRFRNSVSLR